MMYAYLPSGKEEAQHLRSPSKILEKRAQSLQMNPELLASGEQAITVPHCTAECT